MHVYCQGSPSINGKTATCTARYYLNRVIAEFVEVLPKIASPEAVSNTQPCLTSQPLQNVSLDLGFDQASSDIRLGCCFLTIPSDRRSQFSFPTGSPRPISHPNRALRAPRPHRPLPSPSQGPRSHLPIPHRLSNHPSLRSPCPHPRRLPEWRGPDLPI